MRERGNPSSIMSAQSRPGTVCLPAILSRFRPRCAMLASTPGRQKETGRERVLRLQTELGGCSAGSSRTTRLDPLALPVRFTASDAGADERLRQVELHRERVILRRAVQGMRIALNVPVRAFRGISIRLFEPQDGTPAGVA